MLSPQFFIDLLLAGQFFFAVGVGAWLQLEKLFDFICEKGIDKLLVKWYN